MAGGLAQEQRHGIGRPLGHLSVDVAGVLDALPAAVVADLEASLLERFLESLALVVREPVFLHHLAQLREIDAVGRSLLRTVAELLYGVLQGVAEIGGHR